MQFCILFYFSETNRESLCLHYTHDLDHLVAGYTDGVVRFFKAGTMALVQSLTDEDITESPAPVTNMKHRPVSRNYASTDTLVCTCNINRQNCVQHVP